MIVGHPTPDTANRGPTRTMTRAEARAGPAALAVASEVIEDLLASSPDPIDLVQLDPKLVARYGLTPEQLMDRLGASPEHSHGPPAPESVTSGEPRLVPATPTRSRMRASRARRWSPSVTSASDPS